MLPYLKWNVRFFGLSSIDFTLNYVNFYRLFKYFVANWKVSEIDFYMFTYKCCEEQKDKLLIRVIFSFCRICPLSVTFDDQS